jgi:hypothetical protein
MHLYESAHLEQGKKVGFHRGGYFRFALDVTEYLNSDGSNELVVFVYDPTDSEGDIPCKSTSQSP